MADHDTHDHTGVPGVGVGDATTHIADASDAHDASAISVLDTATNFAGTDVEAVLAELQDNIDGVSAGSGIGTDYASASTNTAQSFTTGAAVAIVDFEDVTFDPGSDITIGASWHYTAPTTGIYRVSAQVGLAASTGWAAGERGLMQLFKNGAVYRQLDRDDSLTSGGAPLNMVLKGSTLVSLTAADTIDIRVAQNSGGTIALDGNTANNYIDIHRIA